MTSKQPSRDNQLLSLAPRPSQERPPTLRMRNDISRAHGIGPAGTRRLSAAELNFAGHQISPASLHLSLDSPCLSSHWLKPSSLERCRDLGGQ